MDVSSVIMAASTSIVAGMSALHLYDLFRHVNAKNKIPPESFGDRLEKLTSGLRSASRQVDSVLGEIAQVAKDREETVQKLESDLAMLKDREKELKGNIDALEKTPLPAAEYFARLLESKEKRSAKRDYFLFGAGVITSAVVTIIIQWIVAG